MTVYATTLRTLIDAGTSADLLSVHTHRDFSAYDASCPRCRADARLLQAGRDRARLYHGEPVLPASQGVASR